jgi:TolB-like protein/DNA-binding winged helix-turn-helix (wHTH) protein
MVSPAVRSGLAGGKLDGLNHGYEVFCFSGFRLDPVSRTLLQNGVRVPLSARLFDTLLYLVKHHDRLVERGELCREIWSTHAVSEGNLGRAISSLRLALKSAGEDYLIITAPGRGYRFGKPVRVERVNQSEAALAGPGGANPPATAPGLNRAGLRATIFGVLVAVIAVGAISVLLRPSRPGSADATAFMPPPRSIAVLPFVGHGADAVTTLYSDGIAQELINALGRVEGLEVAASTSSFQFRNKNAMIGDIARRLNVGSVLEGSVQRAGSRIHVAVELIDAHSGFQIWSHVYDQRQDDVLAMQGRIAAAAVTALKGVILGNGAEQLTLGGTANPAAFDAYLRGEAEAKALDAAANRRAIAYFNQAVALDPKYALAFVGRARALTLISTFGDSPDVGYSHRVMQAARKDAQAAVLLAPELGAAHAALAFALQASLADLVGADAEYRRAIALTPSDAATLLDYGRFQLEMGQVQDGITAAERAAALDPLSGRTYRRLAIILTYARRYGDAKTALDRARVLQPNDALFNRVTLGLLDVMQGDFVAAERVCAGNVDFRDMMCLAMADHMLGRQADAEAEFAKARAALGDNGAYIYARIFAQWGQPLAVLHWLQTAYQLRDPGLIELKIDPIMDLISGTRDYRDLVDKLGFPAS